MSATRAYRRGLASAALALALSGPATAGTLTLTSGSYITLYGVARGEIAYYKNDVSLLSSTARDVIGEAGAPAVSGYVDASEGRISLAAQSMAWPGGSYITQTGVYDASASGGLIYRLSYSGADLTLPDGWMSFLSEGDYGFGAPDYKVTFTSSLSYYQVGSAFASHTTFHNEQHAPSGDADDTVIESIGGPRDWIDVRSTPGRHETVHTAPGLTLEDGDTLEIDLRFQLTAQAFALPAGVNHAFANGANTGAFSLTLPDSVTLDTAVLGPAVPGFVAPPSTVPLPPAGLLLAGGLAALGVARRRARAA